MEWMAVWVTFKLAMATAVILLVLGLPLGYWLASTKWRGRFLVEAVVALPLVLPPTVLGFYVLVLLGPKGPYGTMVRFLFGGDYEVPRVAFTFWGILLASVLCNIPFAVRPFISAFSGVDRKLIEASWSLGVSKLGTFRRVIFPLAWPGILTGLVLTFAHTVGEFGVVLMVGGDISGSTRTLSLVIFDQIQTMDYAAAHVTALLLLGFSFVVLAITYALQRRVLPI